MQLTDAEVIDLLVSTLDSPYANYLTRQFVLTALTKISSRPTTTDGQQERIQTILASCTTSPELEIQQRAVEFANLFNLGEIRSGVLERMPAPELKQTVIGVGEWSAVGLYIRLIGLQSVRTNLWGPCSQAKT